VVPPDESLMTLAVRRALILMLARAVTEPATLHRISKAQLRRGHKSNERIGQTLDVLSSLRVVSEDQSSRGRPSLNRISFFEKINEENSESGGAWIEYALHSDIRNIIESSQNYAEIEIETIFKFRSKYSLALYERGCLLYSRKYPTRRLSICEFRSILNIGENELVEWSSIRTCVLDVAAIELKKYTNLFRFVWKAIYERRKVIAVELSFYKATTGRDEENEQGKEGEKVIHSSFAPAPNSLG